MNTTRADNFLSHYGVPGMKWGVRRSRAQLSKSKENKTRFKESGKDLTSDELSRRIARLETEKRYNDLNARTVSQGEKAVVEILTNVGKGTTTKVLSGIALFAAKKAVEKKFGKEVADNIKKK